MDENNTTPVMEEQAADQSDSFIDGWDDEATDTAEVSEETADQTEETTEQADAAEEEQPKEEQPAAEPAEGETTEGAAEAKVEEEPAWLVKHMGEEKTLKSSDITPELLQKGLDYDRVRSKYDEAKPIIELFGEYAKKQNMSLAEYSKYLRAQAKEASGMSADEARRSVDLEDREAAIAAKEAEHSAESTAAAEREAKVKADLADFAMAFPEVYEMAKNDPKVIPQSVWDGVNSGKMSLTAAYSRYAVAQANEKAKAAEAAAAVAGQNNKNASRATGSMKSAGSDTKSKDAFLDGWGD